MLYNTIKGNTVQFDPVACSWKLCAMGESLLIDEGGGKEDCRKDRIYVSSDGWSLVGVL